MANAFAPLQPKVVLGIAAHPDDLEFGMAGTIAKYIAEGATGYYLILTNANKGSADADMTPERLRDLRREEQRAAGNVLGLTDVFFGDYEDGCLEPTMEVKRDIVRVIRQVKPDVVLTMDPTFRYDPERGYIEHPDHRAAGEATLAAVYPLARDHLSCPDLFNDERLEPHKVATVLLMHFGQENFRVDITPYMDTKLQALSEHKSQLPDPDAAFEMVRGWAAKHGSKVGTTYAEGFVRIDLSL